MGRFVHVGRLLPLFVVAVLCSPAGAGDGPAELDKATVPKLVSEAASISPRFLNTVVSLGAKFSLADLTKPDADVPMTLVVMVLGQAGINARDFKFQEPGSPRDLMRALYPTDVRAGESVPRHAYASIIHPEYIQGITTEVVAKTAKGTVRFRVPGVYDGTLEFIAARGSAGWRITELRLPHTDVRTVLVDGRWRLLASPTPKRMARSALTLPSVGTVGTLPMDAPVLVISFTREGYLRVPDREQPLSLTDLRIHLMARTRGERLRADNGSSRVHALLDFDATTPWVVTQWIMMACAHPAVQINKVWLGAQTRDGTPGAVAAWLPRDQSFRGIPGAVTKPGLITVRMFQTTKTTQPTDLRVFYAALKQRLARGGAAAKPRFELITVPPKGGAVPHGFVLGALDACLAAGALHVNFEGAALPLASDLFGSAEKLRAYVNDLRQRPGVPVIRKRPGAQYHGAAKPGQHAIPSQGHVQRPWGAGLQVNLGETIWMEEPPESDVDDLEGLTDAPFDDPKDNGKIGPEAAPTQLQREHISILAALKWLTAHQAPTGMFPAADFDKWCKHKPRGEGGAGLDGQGKRAYDVGVTGLALQAFLGAGYTNRGAHPFKNAVSKGLRALKNVQDPEGCFGPRSSPHYIYNHAMAALAMVQAYGKTRSPIFKGSAQRALNFGAMARNAYLGWRYGVKPGDNDTSVSGWMFLVLHTAQRINEKAVGLGQAPPFRIDPGAADGMRAWLKRMTDEASGRVGYTVRGNGPARPKELLTRFPSTRSASLTAIGVFARILMGDNPRASVQLKRGLAIIAALPPIWDPASGDIDMYYWHWGTLAMQQAGGAQNEAWRAALNKALLHHQRRDGDVCEAKGSWDPIGPWGLDGGRVYSTALLTLCLTAHKRSR